MSISIRLFQYGLRCDCAALQFSSFGKDVQPEHAREDSGLEMDSPESRSRLVQ